MVTQGYFSVDAVVGKEITLILIPDGKIQSTMPKGMVAVDPIKANAELKASKKDAKAVKASPSKKEINKPKYKPVLYRVKPINDHSSVIDISKVPIYKLKPLYTNFEFGDTPAPLSNVASKKENIKPAAAKKGVEVAAADVLPIQMVEMRVGKILSVKRHENAESLYVEEIDLGEAKPRTVVSGLVKYLAIDQMINQKVIVVCNLKPANMRGVTSQGMVLVASDPSDEMKKELIVPPTAAKPGDLVTFDGFPSKKR